MSTKICEYCGNSYEPNKITFSRQRFCSKKCERDWWKENRDREKDKRNTFVCQNCGKEYKTAYKDRNTCCSRECGWELKSKRSLLDKECLSCGQKFKGFTNDKYCSSECKERGVRCNCTVCGKEFCGRANSIVCSKECEKVINRRRYEQYMTEKTQDRTYTCKECGIEFIALYGDKRNSFCSDECGKLFNGRIHKRTRRALKKSNGLVQRINPLEIYKRDGWRCGICGKRVNPKLKYPNPMSASLDHIIALAKGGTHTFENVQLAHLKCNINKRDIGGGQLRLSEYQAAFISRDSGSK